MLGPSRRFGSILAIGLLLGSLGLPLLAAPAAALGERVYDANTVIGGTDPFLLVYSAQSVAQSFTASGTYILLNVTLRLRNAGGTTDTVNITIQTDSGGVPSGTVLAWSNPLAPGTVGPISAPLTPTPTLRQGIVYWIVAVKGNNAIDAYEWHHSGGNTYAGGKAMVNTGSGWTNPATATDLWFLTYGRELNTNLTIAMTTPAPIVQPKDLVTFTLYLNNTGQLVAQTAWVNDSLPAGLVFVSDTSAGVPATAGFPNYTFANLANGVHSFTITARVATSVAPGAVLTNLASLAYTNATGVLGPQGTAKASLTVGLQGKQLYLVPGNPGPPQGLVPTPPTAASGTTFTVRRNGASVDFQLVAPLARTFRLMNVSPVLYLDSASHGVKNLDMNFTLLDVNGSTLTPLAYEQQRVTTDNVNGFQKFTYLFPRLDVNVSTGHAIDLRVRNMGTSQDDALLATNATATPSRIEILTSTYVRVDVLGLLDAKGPATVWSPKDLLAIRANVSDPFGAAEIAGAWLNLTGPSGSPVLTSAVMTLIGNDTSAVPAWSLFQTLYGPPLTNGTYQVEVRVQEANGVLAYATASALVRAPAFTLSLVPTQASALSGDTFFYVVWYNNAGPGPASRVWANVSLPSQVLFVTSSAEPNRTGAGTWLFTNIAPGDHFFLVEVQVRTGIPPAPWILAVASLNDTDEKGFLWPSLVATAGVILQGPVVSLAMSSSTLTIHSNETFVLTIRARNTGDLAQTLWLNLSLPSALAYVTDTAPSVGGLSSSTSSGVDIRLANLTSGSAWTIDVTVRSGPGLSRGRNLTGIASLDYTNARGGLMPSGAAMTTVTVIAPAIENTSLTAVGTPAIPGGVVRASIVFANAGDEAALSLVVTLSLDPDLAFLNASVSATVSGRVVFFVLSNVGLGTMRIAVNLSVSRTASDRAVLGTLGTLAYTDRLGNPMPLVGLGTANVTVTAPVLVWSALPTNATAEAGTLVTYRIAVANGGTGVAQDAWLNATLPTDLLYVSDTSDGQRTALGNALSWHWSGLGPGSKTFDLVLEVRPSTPDGSKTSVPFTLQYTDVNGNRRPDVYRSLGASVIAPTIALNLTVSANAVSTGTTFYYTLRVRNSGTTMTKTLWLLDLLDDQLKMFSYTANVPATGTADLNWTFRTLQPGEEEAITLFVQTNGSVPVGTQIPNFISAIYTNSNGTVVGFVQSATVVVTVTEPASILPYILVGAGGAGGAIAFVVYRRRRSMIEEVFLVSREDGILLDHLSRRLVQDTDPDVVSGMLTGIQQFVKDAFKLGEDRNLHEMEFGDYRVFIERGNWVYIAVVTSGGAGIGIGRKLRKVLEEIEASHRDVLEKWNGDMDKMLAVRDQIRKELLA
ncbi:MAG: choice-of-anchor R domain-containing protein [Thermoplasmata archaeon]